MARSSARAKSDKLTEYPYGVVFREFFGKDGGFRKTPEDAAFDAVGKQLMAETDKPKLEMLTAQMNRYVHDQANVATVPTWCCSATSCSAARRPA